MEVWLQLGGGVVERGLSAARASDGFPPQLLLRQHSLSHGAARLYRTGLSVHLSSAGPPCVLHILKDFCIFVDMDGS